MLILTAERGRRPLFPPALLLLLLMAAGARPSLAQEQQDRDAARPNKDRRPTISLRATPAVGFSPVRVFLVAELRGGADDYEQFYCAAAEWDWGDGTKSQAAYDCDPYEPGKSQIKRRFVTEHVFHQAGSFRLEFRLKRNDKVLGFATATVQIRPGIRDSRF